jgi:hypothetical protein
VKGTAANLALPALAQAAQEVLAVLRRDGAAGAEIAGLRAVIRPARAWLASDRLDGWLAALSAR